MLEDEDNPFAMKFLLILIGIVVYAIVRRNAGQYYVNKGLFELLCAGLLFFSAEFFFWYFRYWMPHVTVNGFSGSIGRRPIPAGNYLIFACGEVFEPFHLKGRLHTLVVHKNAIKRAGRNYTGVVLAQRTPVLNLPEAPHNVIYENKDEFNADLVFLAEYTEEFIRKNTDPLKEHEDLPSFIEEKKVLNRRINIRTRQLQGDFEMMEEMMETASSLGQKKSWKDYIPGFKRTEEEKKE